MLDARTSATAMDVDGNVPVDADDASLLAQVRQLKADKLMLEVEFGRRWSLALTSRVRFFTGTTLEQQCHTLEHTNSELVTERDEWHGKAEKLKKELASAGMRR